MRTETAPPPQPQRARWVLHIQAQFWRVLMGIGMTLHRLARPLPPSPAFHRTVKSTISPLKGQFQLHFYVPKDYNARKKLKGKKYPVVINFHGGGFTLGTAHDDARWAGAVVENVDAVVVGVDYRLAPEHPFPTAVEDGADAILYLARHAHELMLDPDRFAVSGFSSGGNMSFTVPLCLQGELLEEGSSYRPLVVPKPIPSAQGSTNSLAPPPSLLAPPRRPQALNQTGASTLSLVSTAKTGTAVSVFTEGVEITLRGIVAFYPPTDYTRTRDERRQTCLRKDQELPAIFTQLFDESYLQPPTLDKANPWLSPGVAPSHMLAALPDDIVMFTCEWDMLLAEGEAFRDRLRNEHGKRLHYHMIPGVPHGWDKAPNPLKESPGSREQYLVACKELKRMFGIAQEEDIENDDALARGPSNSS